MDKLQGHLEGGSIAGVTMKVRHAKRTPRLHTNAEHSNSLHNHPALPGAFRARDAARWERAARRRASLLRPQFAWDREFLFLAAKPNRLLALAFVADEIRADREVVLNAVEHDGLLLH